MPNYMHPVLRFLIRVHIRTDGCWEWLGGKKETGYGRVRLTGHHKTERANRVMWYLVHGSCPDEKHVLHACDNPSCVNPSHLELGDHTLNMRQMSERNRNLRGEDKPDSKLTEEDVRNIRQDIRSARDLAKYYPVHHTTIHSIKTRKKWRHVND